MSGVPIFALRGEDTQKSQPETFGEQVVDDGIYSRTQVEENT